MRRDAAAMLARRCAQRTGNGLVRKGRKSRSTTATWAMPCVRAMSNAAGRIPIIDISPFLSTTGSSASSEDRARTAQELAQACEHFGFFYVVNHGVDDALLLGVQRMARGFFSCSLPHKLRYAMQEHGPSLGRGYQQLGLNVTTGARDWHEAVDMFRQLSVQELADPALHQAILHRPELADLLAGRNVWPSEFDRVLTERYIASMRRLGAAVMRAMAVSIGLPQSFFESNALTDDPFWVLRFIHYPASAPAVDDVGDAQGLGCGAHTDYGCLTIVNQDETPGCLEIKAKNGQWIQAGPRTGALCLNIGDMVERWTRGRFKSTLHRVQRPPPNCSRISVPFFFEPNALACIRPLVPSLPTGATFSDATSPPTHPRGAKATPAYEGEIRYIEHLYSKVTTNFDSSPRD